jgi:hypothetical protein
MRREHARANATTTGRRKQGGDCTFSAKLAKKAIALGAFYPEFSRGSIHHQLSFCQPPVEGPAPDIEAHPAPKSPHPVPGS